MSHHLRNPFASGDQSSTQGRYGLGEMDPHSETFHFGPGRSSSGPPTVASATSGGMIPPLAQSVGYRPEPKRTSIDDDLGRSVDIPISRPRDGDPGHQPTGQRTHYLSTRRDDYQSSRLHTSSYPQSSSSASHSHQYSNVESKQSSIDWLPKYKGSADEDSSRFYSSPSSSSRTHSSDGTFTSSTEGQRDVMGSRGYENSQPKYTSQSAVNILLRFGLEKEDLEYLISYPEDQLTPSNLPFILRQIRMQKTKSSTAAVESKPYSEPQPIRGSEMGFAGPLPIPKPPQVIDYGHTGKYFGGTGRTDSIGEDSSMVESYEQCTSSGSRGQVQKDSIEFKDSTLVSPRDQSCSDTRLSSSYQQAASSINDPTKQSSFATPCSSLDRSVAPTSKKPTKQSYNQPSQTSPLTCNTLKLQQKEPNRQVLISEPKPLSFNEPGAVTKPTLPKRKGLVLIDKTYSKGTLDNSKSHGQNAAVTKHIKKEPEQNKDVKKKEERKQKPEQRKESEKTQKQQAEVPKQPQSQLENLLWSAFLPMQPAPAMPSSSVQYPVPYFKPDASPVGNPPPSTSTWNQTSLHKDVVKLPGMQIQPSLAMMHDYAAATPKVFPHICSLCFKECNTLKSWISHQNTSLHLQSCKQLRIIYPQWNGEVLVKSRSLNKDAKSASSTSARTSQKHHGSRSHSRSSSPNRRPGSKNKKPKRSRSRSRSPRYSRSSSHSPQHGRYRSRSRSHERERRWRRRSSRTRSSEESQPSPKRSRERRSTSRRREDRRSSPEWRSHRRSPPGSSKDRWLSPQRRRERCSPPRRSDVRSDTRRSPVSRDDRRPASRHSHERRALREKSPEPQKSSSAERLVKKLLQRTAGQSQSEAELEAVVKTLLAEITKTKSSSTAEMESKYSKSSASGSSRSSDFASSSTSVSSSSTSATSSLAKKTATSTKAGLLKDSVDKSSPVSAPTMVRLEGITNVLSRNDVIAALECFGRIKSIILSRKKEQALVCFEKEEDANKVKSIKSMEVKGISVTVMRKKDPVVKKTPLKKSATTNEFTPCKKKPTVRKTATPLSKGLKQPLTSQVMRSTQGTSVKKSSLSTRVKTAPKGSVKGKGSPGVSRAKVLVSKAKHVSKYSKKVPRKRISMAQINQKDVAAPVKVTVAETSNFQDDSAAKFNMERNLAVQEPEAPKESPISVENAAEPTSVSRTTAVESPQAVHLEDLPADVQLSVEVPEKFVLEQQDLEETQETEPTQVELEVKEAKDTEPMDVEVTIPEMSEERMETGSCAQAEEEKESNTESIQEEPPTETRTDIPKPEADSCTPRETKAPPEPHTDPRPEPKLELEKGHCQPSVSTGVPEKKDLSAVKNQRGPEMAPVLFKAGESLKATASTVVYCQKPCLKVFEMDQTMFNQTKFPSYNLKNVLLPKFLKTHDTTVMIRNLPVHWKDSYTEQELAQHLEVAGFDYKDENIYVNPQARVAFCVLPSPAMVQKLVRTQIFFKSYKLIFSVPCIGYTLTPYLFYKFLLKKLTGNVANPAGTIYVKNISAVQTEKLMEFLRDNIQRPPMFMPFLNKVFVEFETLFDADLLGVWFSLVKPSPSFTMYRLLIPQTGGKSLNVDFIPKSVINSFAEGMDFKSASLTPLGSSPPFWLAIHTRPYVFPTVSMWFQVPNIPKNRLDDDARVRNSQCILMVTGLPEGRYTQEDVARLFWPYFPKKNLRTLYYNVLVLILQKRAFIHFTDWTSCLKFLKQHKKKQLTVGGSALNMHFVKDWMATESSEELMFIQLLKLSNSRVPDPESLEERLLCVEIAEATVNIVTLVMEVVASIAKFVRFLPLANRICVEMAESSGVIKVVETHKEYRPLSQIRLNTWNKVIRFESVESLKQRLRDADEFTIDLHTNLPGSTAGAGSTSTHTTSSMVDVSLKGTEKLEGTGRPRPDMTVQPRKVQYLTASNVVRFDQQNFNMDDFITVDEVGEDVGEASAYEHCAQADRQIRKREEQHEPEAICKDGMAARSVRNTKNLDSLSPPSSSKFTEDYRKRSPCPNSISALPKKSRLSSKSPSPQPSSSYTQGKSKAQITSSFCSDSRPSSVVKSESAMMKSDHIVSVEKSKKKMETSSEMHPQRQDSEISEDRDGSGTGFKDVSIQDLEERKDSLKEITDEEEQEGNYRILDSFEEQMENEVNERNQTGNFDSQFPEHGDIFHVLDSVGDDAAEFCTQTTVEGPKGLTEDLLKDTDNSGEKVSDSEVLVQENNQSNEKPANNKTEENKDLSQEIENLHFQLNQSGAEEEEDGKIQGKAPTAKSSNSAEKIDEQMAEVKHQPLKDWHSPSSEQQQFEILPRKEDQSVMVKPKSQNDQEVIMQTEEEVVYQVVDSIEDQPDVTPTEPEDKKSRDERESTPKTEESSSTHCGQRARTTVTEITETGKTRTEELTEDMEFKVLDSVEDEPTVAATTFERPAGRRSTRGKKEAPEKPQVDDEVVFVRTRSSSRRRDGSTRKDGLTVGSNKEDTPSRRMHNPARETLRTQEEASEESRSMDRVDIIVKDDPEEEATYEILDSVDDNDDKPSRGRKRKFEKPNGKEEQHSKERTTVKKTEHIVREEDTYEILDSLEVTKEEHPVTRRKRGRPKKEEKPAKKEPDQHIKCEKGADGEEVASYQVTDSLEAQMVDCHPNMEQSKSLRKTRASKIDKASTEERTPRTRSRKSKSKEEEPLYQIVDSVEDEQIQEEVKKAEVYKEPNESNQDTPSISTAGENRNDKTKDIFDHQPEDTETERSGEQKTPENEGKTKGSENEGKAVYEIVDSLEDCQVTEQLLTPEVSKDTQGETSCSIIVVEKTEVVVKVSHDGGDALSAEGPAASTNALVNLDEVSDEEEDFPDDVEEEEESRKRHTRRLSKNSEGTSGEKETGIRGISDSPSIEQEQLMCGITADEKSVKDLEEVSDASSVTEESSETQRETTTQSMKKNQESSQKNDSAPVRVTLVNLDQVSDEEEDFPDDTVVEEELRKKQAAVKDQRLAKEKETEQEAPTTRERSNRDGRGRSSSRGGESSGEGKRGVKECSRERVVDIKELVTLDEVGGDETGEEVAAQSQESESEELLGLVTLDEIREDDDEEKGSSCFEEKPVASSNKETLVSPEADDDKDDKSNKPHVTLNFPVKCKNEPEEGIDFVTVDEVGEFVEEEKKPTPRGQGRGRGKRRSRTTAVRKSPRGGTSAERNSKEEQEPVPDGSVRPHLLDTPSPVNNPTKIQKDADSECQNINESEGLSKALSKRKVELLGPEAKRSRSESPCCSVKTTLPPFHPDKSLGEEFVVPTMGFFCKLCSTFYVKDITNTQDPHCSSREHYDRLREHYQDLEEKSKPPRRSGRRTQGYISD